MRFIIKTNRYHIKLSSLVQSTNIDPRLRRHESITARSVQLGETGHPSHNAYTQSEHLNSNLNENIRQTNVIKDRSSKYLHKTYVVTSLSSRTYFVS